VLRFIVALFVCVVAGVSVAASAETCPGNPDALGTSRVLTINPGEFTLLGTMQYQQTLPLGDREVVITFDDGPLLPYTNIILDTLASQCVKATYFLVGQMAHANPSDVRRIYNEGHTIGTHSQHHPYFERLSMQRVEREVDGGIDSVTAALGDAKAPSRLSSAFLTSAAPMRLNGSWSASSLSPGARTSTRTIGGAAVVRERS
jgi:peptidoglycan-N-acetylglucosamine deacetylase